MKDAVAAELNLHATEELNHANLLAARIINSEQCGHRPQALVRPQPVTLSLPTTRTSPVLLDQNIAGEQCAISAYSGS